MRIVAMLMGMIWLLASWGRADEPAMDHWRVVVQDVAPEVLAVSADGRLIAARGRWSQHVFYVLDQNAARVVLSVHLPREIQSAACGPGGDWFAVSTEEHVYRVGLADGSLKRLLEGVAGTVALDSAGRRLAVLGQLDDEPDQRRSFRWGPTRLGIYDLERGRWLARADTPILAGHLAVFDGDAVIAAGRGGRVFHRAASSYPCHVRLDPATGQSSTSRGLETGPGARPLPQPQPQADYAPPEIVRATREKLATAAKAVESSLQRLSSTGKPVLRGDHFALVADQKRVLAVTDRGYLHRSLLTVHHDGRIEVRAIEIGYGGVDFCDGRLLSQHRGEERDRVVALETGKEVFSVPHVSTSIRTGWVRFLPAGCLVRQGDRLQFYHPDAPSLRWEREVPTGLDNPYPLANSPDGSRLALGLGGDSADFVLIVSARTGETVGRIPRPDGDDGRGYALAVAFSQNGKRLIVSYRRSLRVYDALTGQLQHERALTESEYVWSATGVGDGWLLGADNHSRFFDERHEAETAVPLPRIDKVQPIRTLDRAPLLVETGSYLGGVVTPDGTVRRAWVLGASGSIRDRNAPPLSSVAFSGRVIARLTGTTAIEFVDTTILEPVAGIHVLKLPKGFGWVAYTPDGHWDASPGAERNMVVFRNGQAAEPDEARSRRIPSLLQERLPR